MVILKIEGIKVLIGKSNIMITEECICLKSEIR